MTRNPFVFTRPSAAARLVPVGLLAVLALVALFVAAAAIGVWADDTSAQLVAGVRR